MKKMFLLLTVAIALVSCNNDDASDGIQVQKEGDAIKSLVTETYRNALAASNPDAVTSAFTTDGVVMGHGSPTAAGTTELKNTYESIFGIVGLDLNFKIDEIIVGNQYGFVRSTSAGKATMKANGSSAPEENRELFVVQKVNDQWKIARYIYNKMGTLSQATDTKTVENKSISYTDEDSKNISTLINSSYANAIASADAQAVSNIFTTDGVLMAPDAPTMVGNAAIKSTYESVFGAIGLDLVFTIDEMVIDGEYGYVRSHSAGTTLIRANGQTVPASYREMFVVKKVDGNWKIAWYKYNQPQ
ncbi:DUF4440 domain-containing protein [Rhodocytophaga aerolata]|uniref:DUF4440 domain-containing protein n=1 Tax=Rhodocytophaga aerolata TaxID=455078 RepID=A0ABT8REP0_9BACT|nr:DUF4440 domain-containing protein [Rhodocytophaga aerolata]MDO1449187.1 DUF4440 domain-containing protein [Rhodocytophaga aerolata]